MHGTWQRSRCEWLKILLCNLLATATSIGGAHALAKVRLRNNRGGNSLPRNTQAHANLPIAFAIPPAVAPTLGPLFLQKMRFLL